MERIKNEERFLPIKVKNATGSLAQWMNWQKKELI